MPKTSNFRLPRGHRFFATNGSYGYGAKSRWGHPRIHLGDNGVPLGQKKWVKTVKIYHAPNWNFRLPRGHWFFAKNGSCSYGAKSRWGPLRVYLWANGVPLRPKNGSKRRKLPCPKIRIFIDFSQKMEVTVMARNHGGDPLGSILGPMGSHWVQRKGQNCKKLQFRKIRTFD